MKAAGAILLLVIALCAADYQFLNARLMERGWNAALNQPNASCNFDDECARKLVPSRVGGNCAPYKCVAASWKPNPFPVQPQRKTGYRSVRCGKQMDDTGSCECVNYNCRFKREGE